MENKYSLVEVIILMFICGLFSIMIFDLKSKSETEIKQVPISDRITACEEKGGRYKYSWSYYYKKYIESCYTEEIIIEDF